MDKGTKKFLMFYGAASVIGALTGLGLSFTALSPLVIGGIIAAAPMILFTAYDILNGARKGTLSKKGFFFDACLCIASAAIGVGLAAAAAATAIFPGTMLGAALAGATIGVIAPIAAVFVVIATLFAAEKVNEYIISSIVECFSSKGEGYDSI